MTVKRFLLAGTLLNLLVIGTVAFTHTTASSGLALQHSSNLNNQRSFLRYSGGCACADRPQQRRQHQASSLFLARRYTRPSIPQLNQARQCLPTFRRTALSATSTRESLSQFARIVFHYEGKVPLLYSFGINVVLFAILRTKLLSALTPAGFFNALGLGTMLWTTLGWRGWSYCVLYLVFGQLVTKIRFTDKEKRGLAEGRGGRRGPENVSTISRRSLAWLALTN